MCEFGKNLTGSSSTSIRTVYVPDGRVLKTLAAVLDGITQTRHTSCPCNQRQIDLLCVCVYVYARVCEHEWIYLYMDRSIMM